MLALVLNPVGLNAVTLARKSFSFKLDITSSNFGGDDFIFDAISSSVKYVPGISDSLRHLLSVFSQTLSTSRLEISNNMF